MDELALIGYPAAFGLWAALIYREGGLGVGFRFMYGTNLVLFFLLGPLLGEVFGTQDARFFVNPIGPAVHMALIAVLAYSFGGYVLCPALLRRQTILPPGFARRLADPVRLRSQYRVAWSLIGIGVLCLPIFRYGNSIPTFGVMLGQSVNLIDAGAVMLVMYFACTRDWNTLLAAGAVFTLKYTVFAALTGHAGNMFIYGMVIVCLAAFAFEVRAVYVPVVAALAVTVFIPASYWLAGRQQLREAITQGAGWDKQIEITINIFTNPAEVQSDRRLVDIYRDRGDFSDLMAAAIAHTPAREPFAAGDTYLDAFVALVPRAIWPDKPYKFGGSVFVSRFTGIQFAEGTSVGMNYMFEMYINFGYFGVVAGMTILGMILGYMEHLYYTRGVNDLSIEYTLILTSWTVCFTTDKFAEALMASVPGVAMCWLITRGLKKTYDLPYLTTLGPRVRGRRR